MGVIIFLFLFFGGVFYLRHTTTQKVGALLAAMDELSVELEVVIRSEDFTALESIANQSEVISRNYPLLARFGDFRPLRAEFINRYNQLNTKIDAVYRELEIRQRVNERGN